MTNILHLIDQLAVCAIIIIYNLQVSESITLIKYLNRQLKRLCIRVVTDQFCQLANQSAHTVHHVCDNYGVHKITNQSVMTVATLDK